jgi:two-component system cell cycle response regulator
MTHLANVLVAMADRDMASQICSRLRRGGYSGSIVESSASAMERAAQEHPDIVVIGNSITGSDSISLAHALRANPRTSNIPLLLIEREMTPELCEKMMELGIDDAIEPTAPDDVLIARLRPLVRLSTMYAELDRRASVAREFGLNVSGRIESPVQEPSHDLLVISSDEAETSEIRDTLAGATVTNCTKLYEAEYLLSRHNYDAAILCVRDKPEDFLNLCAQIRNNPRLFNLPVVMVADYGVLDPIEPYRRGASRVLERPLDAATLRSLVYTLVRRQRLRWRIREALLRTQGPESCDAHTGAYSRALLSAHLRNRVDYAKNRQRHLSVVSFQIPNIDGVREEFGEPAADNLLAQAGRWISGLLRVEDMSARGDGNEYVVVLPDTPIEEANIVMHRIAGVLNYTDFAVPDVYQPVKVWVQVGSADVSAEDDVEAVLTRARASHN